MTAAARRRPHRGYASRDADADGAGGEVNGGDVVLNRERAEAAEAVAIWAAVRLSTTGAERAAAAEAEDAATRAWMAVDAAWRRASRIRVVS